MTEKPPEYKIFAIKYATRDARRSDHFIGGDPHDGPMPMDYFTSAVVDRVFLEHFARHSRSAGCVIPADGFHEWTRPKNARRPTCFHRGDGGPLLFAGLYES